MNLVKRIMIFSCLVPCLLVLTGCEDSTPPDSSKSAANAHVLNVAFEGMTVPCNWTQDSDAHGAVPIQGSKQFLCGFEIDYMKKVCELAGFELKAHKFDWDGMLLAVSTGKVDCAISMVTSSPERRRTMNFTEPYYYGETVGVVRKSSKFAAATSIEDLKGARATSMLNTLWYSAQIDRIPGVNKLPAMETVPTLVVALQSGTTDLILLDRPTAEALTISNPDLMVLPFSGMDGFNTSREEIACSIVLPKGQDGLRARLNAAMAQISPEEVEAMVRDACRNQPLNKLP